MNKYTNIDEYIANFEPEVKTILEWIRETTNELAPDGSTEAITYGIPTIKIMGKNSLHFGGYPHHVAIYPASDIMIKEIPELGKYRTGKGTLQFKLGEDMPYLVMTKAIEYLVTT
jgi:uncharacterized protein YdhG (YjbR/CyaY superfamily)